MMIDQAIKQILKNDEIVLLQEFAAKINKTVFLQNFSETKIRGGFYGVALGDALGWPYEGKSIYENSIIHEDVILSFSGKSEPGREKIIPGQFSDDTQMSIDVASCLIEKGYIDPSYLLKLNSEYFIRGAGPAVIKALYNFRFGAEWYEAGCDLPYNGGAMRVLPIGVFYHNNIFELIINTILSCYITHTNYNAIAASVVMAFSAAFTYDAKPDFFKFNKNKFIFIELLVSIAKIIEEIFINKSPRQTEEKKVSNQLELLTGLIDDHSSSPRNFLGEIGFSVLAYESVVAAIFIFLLFPESFSDIVITAIHAGQDCDSTAAMAGGLCGLLNGTKVFPQGLITTLKDKNTIDSVIEQMIIRTNRE